MSNRKCHGSLLAGAAIALSSACSHVPSAADIPPSATFITKILADGTKLFTYSVRLMMRGGANGSDGEEIDGERGNGRGGADRSKQLAQSSQRAIEAMLAQNHYCREGYVVLEQYDEHGKYIVRGECRDAATSADREKFSQQ